MRTYSLVKLEINCTRFGSWIRGGLVGVKVSGGKAEPYLQQLWHDGKYFRVTDIDGVIPVGLLFVPDVPQVQDRRQQRENPKQTEFIFTRFFIEWMKKQILPSRAMSLFGSFFQFSIQSIHFASCQKDFHLVKYQTCIPTVSLKIL